MDCNIGGVEIMLAPQKHDWKEFTFGMRCGISADEETCGSKTGLKLQEYY